VGTGLSDDERKNPPPIGSIVTYRYQELSNDGVPRFPSYVGIRDDVAFPGDVAVPVRGPSPAAAPRPAAASAAAPVGAAPATSRSASPRIEPEPEVLYRRFERDGRSWEIALDGKSHRIRRVLAAGGLETSTRTFPNARAAWLDAERKVNEARADGYSEVEADD
jgi:DNA ligase-1